MNKNKNSKKILGTFALVMINIIAVDSLRTLPFSAEYGFSLVFYYLLAAVIFFIPVALVSAELATGWPNKGGIYIWVREAFGKRLSFLTIWLQWVYNVVWYPTILSFVAGALAFLIDPKLADNKIFMLLMVLGIFWASTFVNTFGMKASGAVSTAGALIGTLIPMFFIIALCAYWLYAGKPSQVAFTWHNFFPHNLRINNLSFFLAVLFGLIGVELSAVHADEVEDPGRSYPKAILYSTTIIIITLTLASLAIATVVPHDKLNVVTGLVQAFQIFFANYNMNWMDPVITILIILGGVCSVATWIIGPTKGLLVATQDGSAPAFFAKTNKHGVPTTILLIQAVLLTILCSVFLLMPTVSGSYWLLTAMTAQLAMIVYIFLLAAAIRLRYKSPDVNRTFRIPFGNIGMWIVVLLGCASCVGAILLGFFPPPEVKVGGLLRYETILIVGILALCVPPFLIHRFSNGQKSDSLHIQQQ